jgi:hypothetical protein
MKNLKLIPEIVPLHREVLGGASLIALTVAGLFRLFFSYERLD